MSTSGAVATLTITEGASASDTAPGSFTIALAANASGIRDATGNQASFITTAPTDAAPPARVSMSMLDSSGVSGKVDHVTATFSEPLAGSTPTAGQWTLASTPSNGTLASVSTNGTAIATLTLTEGTGPANTAVGSFTLTLAADSTGIRDAAGNQSSFTATAPTDAAAPVKTALQMLDANHNGRVDQATATFSETLASSTNTLPWTPAAIPSSGTLASVSTSGAVATLTITEGAGARDTALGSFTIALAANASGIRDATGNQASFTTTAPTDAAGPVPIAVSDNDTDTSFLNLTNGKLQSGDAFTATFSEPIASGLPASTPITESTVLVGNARLTITGFTNGALDMGSSDYVLLGISVVYAGTSALSNANKTITITAGTCTLLCINLLQGSGTSMVFVPAPTLLDLAGNGATGSAATGFTIF